VVFELFYFFTFMVFIAPEILFILFIPPKVYFCSVSGTHSNSCYVAPFDIVKHIFIKISFFDTIGLVRIPGNWYKTYQNVYPYFNSRIETVEKTVDMLFIFLFVIFGDLCPKWSYLPILINTVKENDASISVHHRTYFSLYSYLLFLQSRDLLKRYGWSFIY